MKKILVCHTIILVLLSSVIFSCAQAPIANRTSASTEFLKASDFSGSYFVARSKETSHTVEVKFGRSYDDPNSVLISSYKEATLDSAPKGSCIGNARFENSILTGDVVCSGQESVFEVQISPKTTLSDLEQGVAVTVRSNQSGPWLKYSLNKQMTSYF